MVCQQFLFPCLSVPAPFKSLQYSFAEFNTKSGESQNYDTLPGTLTHPDHPAVRVFGGGLHENLKKQGRFELKSETVTKNWLVQQTSHDRGLYELELAFLVDTVLPNAEVEKLFKAVQQALRGYILEALSDAGEDHDGPVNKAFDKVCKEQILTMDLQQVQSRQFETTSGRWLGQQDQDDIQTFTDGLFTIQVDTTKDTAAHCLQRIFFGPGKEEISFSPSENAVWFSDETAAGITAKHGMEAKRQAVIAAFSRQKIVFHSSTHTSPSPVKRLLAFVSGNELTQGHPFTKIWNNLQQEVECKYFGTLNFKSMFAGKFVCTVLYRFFLDLFTEYNLCCGEPHSKTNTIDKIILNH
jgi:hypothetical protein